MIPINMRDGSLLRISKVNPDWNCSVPHDAGRLFGCVAVRYDSMVEPYAREVSGIYTTSVSEETLDE